MCSMALRLRIEADGDFAGATKRGVIVTHCPFVIGRDERADWTLPDPARLVSARHCVIVNEGQGFMLHDCSTNGTFLNGGTARLSGPHAIVEGDHITIGPYV